MADFLKIIESLMRFFKGRKPEREPEGTRGSAETAGEAEASEKREKIVYALEDSAKAYPKAKDGSERIEKELKKLKKKNPKLHQIVMELTQYVKDEFKKDVIITMIHRTQEEQDTLYKDSAKYKKKTFKSPHQFWHGVDLRSWIYTEAEREKMVAWLNAKGSLLNNYYKWTAKVHEVGQNGLHFHIQFCPK